MSRQPGTRSRDYNQQPSTNRFGPTPVEPHSPWQLLVEDRRRITEQSIRVVATRALIPAGTLFNWVRAKSGAPPRIAYTQQVNKRLAEALEVDEEQLAEAYNKSAFRPVDPNVIETPPRPNPAQKNSPELAVDGLRRFLQMLRASGRTSFTIAEIELTAGFLLSPTDPG